MKLRSLTVNQFKKFTSPTCLGRMGDGLNVVVGPNELGKSTLLDALRAVLFEKYSSRARPIMALQNDRNQAAPVVELEFELDDGIYRITKRFIKKSYARLSCPDGSRTEGDVAEERLRELLGFDQPGSTGAKPETLGMWSVLWVQQGQSFGALELPDSARSSLHGALESEVGAVLGGRRGRALPQAIEKQLGELITGTTNRPRGAYKELIEQAASLQGDLDDLQERRRDLTQTLENLETAQITLRRLSDGGRDQTDQEELEEARQRHSQLTELEERIKTATTELELRQDRLAQARQAVAARQKLKDDIKTERRSLEGAEKRLERALGEEREAKSRVDELRTCIRESETSVTTADETESRHRRVLASVERRARLRDLESRHEKAVAAERRQREAKQAAAAILVTDEVLEKVREAERELETIQSRLNASATVISFEMSPENISGIEVDGQALPTDRSTVQAIEPVTIDIPNRGRITVEPAIKDRERSIGRYRDAEVALRNALEDAGAKSPSDAVELNTRRNGLLQDAELARREVELHAPATDEYGAGAQELDIHIEGLRQILNRDMDELDLQELPVRQEAESSLQAAEGRAEEARSALGEARAALSGPLEHLEGLQAGIATHQSSYDGSNSRLNLLQSQLDESETKCPDKELESAVEAAKAAVITQERVIERLQEERTDETVPQLKARIDRLQNAITERQTKRSNLNERIAGLKSRLEVAEGAGIDEAIEQKARDLAIAEEEKNRKDREVKVLGLLLSTLRNAEQQAKERYLSPVLNRVRPYLQLLFPGSNILIDENLRITGVVREHGYEEMFNRLSMGTQEQIAVLVRLAFAEMLVEQGQPATVILDDALVFSDDQRMGRIFDILNMTARNVQVVVFTCREQLFEGLGGQQLSLEQITSDDLTSA